ncbi:MAG: sigma-70 family RNA polymerase sigma factor [Phycisphaerae bacterium]|nr:sigma-70 family RNA polymerase sigma factor [Phycisphaerae bacterium]
MDAASRQDNPSETSRGEVFLRLYQANERRIYGFILALVPDWSHAQDLMQETTMVLWSKFDEFAVGTDFTAWAMSIARYQILNDRKKNRNRTVRFDDEVLEAIEDRVVAAVADVDARRDALRACLQKLDEADRRLIRLRYETGATTRTVADRVGRGIDAVYKALNRIHVQLLFCIRRTLSMEEST